jgi:Rieske Fe-S protein
MKERAATGGGSSSGGRRGFLVATVGLALAWLGAAAYPVYRYLSPRPAPDPFGEDGRAVVKNISPQDVATAGRGGNGAYGQRGCLVFRTPDGELRALDSKCTHAGCNVSFGGDKITCHCHGGVYDLAGKNVSGPPPRPLTPLRVYEEEGVIYVAPEENETEV